MERLTCELIDAISKKHTRYELDGYNKQETMFNAIEKLGKLEDLEKQIRMPLEELVEQYQLYQQAFYLACWGLAEYDDKGCYDEIEASDEWKEIIMKEAEKNLEKIKNEK